MLLLSLLFRVCVLDVGMPVTLLEYDDYVSLNKVGFPCSENAASEIVQIVFSSQYTDADCFG